MSEERTQFEVEEDVPQRVSDDDPATTLTEDDQDLLDRAKAIGIEPEKEEAEPVEEEPEEAPLPEAAEAPQDDRYSKLEKELEYSRRQMGQIQSFLAKLSNQAPQQQETQAQSLLNQLPEDQRTSTVDLVREIIEQNYGEQLRRTSAAAEQVEMEQRSVNNEIAIQTRLGKDFDAVKPVLLSYVSELRDKALGDGPEAEQAVRLIQQYDYFPEALADAAKIRYISEIQAKANGARTKQTAQNVKMTTKAGGKGGADGGDMLSKLQNGKVSLDEVKAYLEANEA